MKNKLTKNIAFGALFAALIAVCSWIAIPVPQTGISFTGKKQLYSVKCMFKRFYHLIQTQLLFKISVI